MALEEWEAEQEEVLLVRTMKDRVAVALQRPPLLVESVLADTFVASPLPVSWVLFDRKRVVELLVRVVERPWEAAVQSEVQEDS